MHAKSDQQDNRRLTPVMMVVMMFVMVIMIMMIMMFSFMMMLVRRVNVSVFHPRTEILQHLLEKKSHQDKKPDQLHLLVFAVELRKDMYHRDTKQIRSCKYQQQFEIGESKTTDYENQQAGKEWRQEKD